MFTDTYKTDLISAAFPIYLRKDVNIILEILSAKAVLHYCIVTDYGNDYTLNEDTVHIPYRIYWSDVTDTEYEKLSQTQKQIISCIYTRSCEGHTREKHVRKLLDMPIEPWVIPFIVKVCDEYVIEILNITYDKLKTRDNTDFKSFCLTNKAQTIKSNSRMISYWNEYHRKQNPDLTRYIGSILFSECFGYPDTSYDEK